MSMTEEKYNEIEPRLKELKQATIKVRKHTHNPVQLVNCEIVNIAINRIESSEGCNGKNLRTSTSIHAYCLLKEVGCNGGGDIEFEMHPFPLDCVYNAFVNNAALEYNPQGKLTINKHIK